MVNMGKERLDGVNGTGVWARASSSSPGGFVKRTKFAKYPFNLASQH